MRELIFLLFSFFLIYLISRQLIKEIYFFLRGIFKSEKMTYIILWLIFFPGTVIHELSHFFAAMILFLPVKDIRLFPQLEEHSIKLGSVHYVKKDFFRGFLVGVAPVFGAMISFWIISHLSVNILTYYLIFAIAATMFSSKKDLEDLIYLVPLVLIMGVVIYIFNIKVSFLIEEVFNLNLLTSFLKRVNHYLLISIFIDIFIFAILKLLRKIF